MKVYDMTGVIDLHIHSAPDVRERSHDDLELAKQAHALGVRAIVIKSHQFPTMDRAYLVNKVVPEVMICGSITLNGAVGGINPQAVSDALKLGAKTVWLPTIHAENHRRKEGHNGGVEVVRDGKVVPQLVEVLKMIADRNVILGTGHLSPEEIRIVAEEARKQGVDKIVVTHPEFHIVGMSIEMQKSFQRDYGVYFERTFAQPIGGGKYASNLETNAWAIQAIGYESTIVSTDGGQIENPLWKDAIVAYIQFLQSYGIPDEAIDRMTKTNPAGLLGLE